jgi:pimeloyl-ACP methyl ester carboxylesterase
MAVFVLLPGAASGPWIWSLVSSELERFGHEAIAVDLPCDDPSAGLPEYVAAALAAIGDRRDLIVVGQSLGAFTGVALTARADVRLLALVAPMIPAPGETPGEWWEHTGHAAAIGALTARHGPPSAWDIAALHEVFFHDVAADAVSQADEHARAQAGGIFATPLAVPAWPDVPTRVLIGGHDRFFPPAFQRRVAAERLGITPDEIATGHLPMLARPVELAERLLAYLPG